MRNTDEDFSKVSFNTDLITCGIFRWFYVDKTTAAAQEQWVKDFCVSNQQSARLPVFESFNMHTDVDAIDCKRRLYEHRNRVCTESCLWEKNPLPRRGIQHVSVLHLAQSSDALATSWDTPPRVWFSIHRIVPCLLWPQRIFLVINKHTTLRIFSRFCSE